MFDTFKRAASLPSFNRMRFIVYRTIRVTGTNLENIARGRYNSEARTMVIEKRPNFRGAV